MKKEPEIWKPIPNYEGLYEVSNYGRVKSLERKIKDSRFGFKNLKERILKSCKRPDGYFIVSLYGKKVKKIYIHHLVVSVFFNNTNSKMNINHIDGDKSNNKLSNLELVTKRENTTHSLINKKKSGLPTGVDKNFNRFRARLKHKGVYYTLGFFDTPEEAHHAYLDALKKYGLTNKYASRQPNI